MSNDQTGEQQAASNADASGTSPDSPGQFSFAIRRPDGSIVLESIAETSAEAWRRAVKYCAIRRAGPDSSGYTLVRVRIEEEPE